MDYFIGQDLTNIRTNGEDGHVWKIFFHILDVSLFACQTFDSFFYQTYGGQHRQGLRSSFEVWRLAVPMQTAQESRSRSHVHDHEETSSQSRLSRAGLSVDFSVSASRYIFVLINSK